jgi:photosystem II stability/assembly factor-like uncharacterized protein
MVRPAFLRLTQTLRIALISLLFCQTVQDRLWAEQAPEENRNIPQGSPKPFSRPRQTRISVGSAATLRLQALQQSQCLPVFGPSWSELGPRPFLGLNPTTNRPDETMSGQVSAIAVDLTHDPSGNLVYVGSSSGGLWRSMNGLSAAPRFVPLSDQAESLSVGSVALDTRANPPTIYMGTGAPDNASNISSYTGVGILISSDGGQTWRRVESADNGAHPFAGQGFSNILIDPTNPNILLASTGLGTDPNFPYASIPNGNPGFQNLGIYRSADAGNTWTQVLSATYTSFYHIDLLYEPTQGTYFAGVSERGLFVSTDRGATWRTLQELGLGQGLPAASQIFRISLATRNGVLWALLLRQPFPQPGENAFELFQSDDHGRSWRQLSLQVQLGAQQEPLPFKGFLMYVAAPPNSNTLLVATERIFRRDNIQDPNSPWVDIEGNLHGDQHAIAFVSATSWYTGDDGGAWATSHRGDSWTSLNEDLRTLEFFSADEDSAGLGSYAGGMQDNGPAFTAGTPAWTQPFFGDGAYVVADPRNSTAFFMSEPRGDIFYLPISSPNNPRSVIKFDGSSPNLGLPADFLTPYEALPTDARLYNGVTNFPGFNFGRARILLTGSNNPWLVAFDPDAPINNIASVPLTSMFNNTTNAIHYIAPAPSDPTTAYFTAGPTTATSLYRLSNISFAGNATVTPITGRPVDGSVLGHLAVSPARPGTLYLTKVGFLEGEKIFKSENGGGTWINVSGSLPNTPLNWITVDPAKPDLVYVATDTGVYVATDGGVEDEQWQRLGSELPNVPVVQTKILPARRLLAATYGRGVWTLDISHLNAKPALQYVAKFVCGKPDSGVVAPGTYFTAVNVHNPQDKPIAFRKKFAIALPGEKAGPLSSFFTAKLCPDEAFEIECGDIFRRTQMSTGFLEGFVVLETDKEFDVVAAYTAAGSTNQVETMELERVSPRRVGPASKPDLLPLNPNPERGTAGLCRLKDGKLVVTIKNQGIADAAGSTTTVDFANSGPVFQPISPIRAGSSVDQLFDVPGSCFGPNCTFKITADSRNEIDESDETNNIANGLCPG